MTLAINKLKECPVEIQAVESTESKPARFKLRIGDRKVKTYSRPSAANGFEEEVQIVLEKFYTDLGYKLPKGFDVHPLNKGWVAIEKN